MKFIEIILLVAGAQTGPESRQSGYCERLKQLVVGHRFTSKSGPNSIHHKKNWASPTSCLDALIGWLRVGQILSIIKKMGKPN
jgi:hypothetical protein